MKSLPVKPGQISWKKTPQGGLRAELSIGGMSFAHEVGAAELAQERAELENVVGFKISLGGLGRALKKVASPKGVLGLVNTAASVIDKIPGAKAALMATGPMGMGVMAGLAATKALAKAKQGDPAAQAAVRQAEKIAQLPAGQQAALAPPNTPMGEIVRYLVAIQKTG